MMLVQLIDDYLRI